MKRFEDLCRQLPYPTVARSLPAVTSHTPSYPVTTLPALDWISLIIASSSGYAICCIEISLPHFWPHHKLLS
jgi:hypothetical protein